MKFKIFIALFTLGTVYATSTYGQQVEDTLGTLDTASANSLMLDLRTSKKQALDVIIALKTSKQRLDTLFSNRKILPQDRLVRYIKVVGTRDSIIKSALTDEQYYIFQMVVSKHLGIQRLKHLEVLEKAEAMEKKIRANEKIKTSKQLER